MRTTAATTPTRRDDDDDDDGFTLIELLVVVLILGILAAVAIPAFLAQRDYAHETAVKADLKNASLAVESFVLNHGGAYTELADTSLSELGIRASANVELEVILRPAGYAITGVSTALAADRAWTYSSATGTISG